jgi:hypothetical protein
VRSRRGMRGRLLETVRFLAHGAVVENDERLIVAEQHECAAHESRDSGEHD